MTIEKQITAGEIARALPKCRKKRRRIHSLLSSGLTKTTTQACRSPSAAARPLVHCHAGCQQAACYRCAPSAWSMVSAQPVPADTGIEAIYPDNDEHSNLLYQVVRKPGKKFFLSVARMEPWRMGLAKARSPSALSLAGSARSLHRIRCRRRERDVETHFVPTQVPGHDERRRRESTLAAGLHRGPTRTGSNSHSG